MSHYIADRDLGLSDQALAVLAVLSRDECDGLAAYDQESKRWRVEITTSAWYNGRERGICLQVRPSLTSKKALLVTFGECRNSDSIFIDAWVVERFFLNPPTHEDFTDEAYAARQYVPYGQVGAARALIRDKIKLFLDEANAPVAALVLTDLGDDDAPSPPPPSPKIEVNDTFTIAPKGNFGGGTSAQGEFVASYKELEAFLGKPSYTGKKGESDGKVSTQWVLVEKFTGATITVYDYMETNLFDNSNPSIRAFRGRPSYAWHIGAHSRLTADRFRTWLSQRLMRKAVAS